MRCFGEVEGSEVRIKKKIKAWFIKKKKNAED
jgi:hypothetical protein